MIIKFITKYPILLNLFIPYFVFYNLYDFYIKKNLKVIFKILKMTDENTPILDCNDDVCDLKEIEDQNISDEQNESEILNDFNNFKDNIFNLDLDNELRIKIINKYYANNSNDFIEIISTIVSMYTISGTKLLQKYIFMIITESIISNFLKIELCKSLINFKEQEEEILSDDDDDFKEIKMFSNEQIKIKNENRENMAYTAINYICSFVAFDDKLPTLLKLEAIFLLMNSDKYINESLKYFFQIINNRNLDCSYRYKTILSLESKNISNKKHFIFESCLEFSQKYFNETMYRILSCQNLLQNHDFYDRKDSFNDVQRLLLSFAESDDIEYNLRADAADVLLNIGDDEMKKKGRNIIIELGKIGGGIQTIYNNAQNVHAKDIEKSVLDIITKLSAYPTIKINDEYITLSFVQDKVLEFQNEMNDIKCNNIVCFNNKDGYGRDENYFCSSACKISFENKTKVVVSFNRISMDKALYCNNTISNVLLKVWSYIENHEEKTQMKNRLVEELIEMAGTCSSGFASRLVNTVTGFGEFNISISWEDQIVSNFYGRLSACAKRITDETSPYYFHLFDDIFKLYLNKIKFMLPHERKQKSKKLENVETHDTNNKYTFEFRKNKYLLGKNIDDVKKECVEEFSSDVLNEMMEKSSDFHKRMNFLLFFKTHMPEIHKEMFSEFKEYITETEFDLAFRRAVSIYDGEN